MSRYLKKKEKRLAVEISPPRITVSSGALTISKDLFTALAAWADEDRLQKRIAELGGVLVPFRVRT